MEATSKTRHQWLSACFVVLLIFFLCPAVAHAVSYVTCDANSYTETELDSLQAIGKHLKLTQNTTFTISSDCYLREICGYTDSTVYDITIVLKDGATLTVDQGQSSKAAIDACNITVTGKGKLLVTGKNYGVMLRGGLFRIYDTSAEIVARSSTGQAITGQASAQVEIEGSEVSISAMKYAVTGVNGSFESFSILGQNSKVLVNGSIGNPLDNRVNHFVMEGGDVSITSSWSSALAAVTSTITGGNLSVNQSGGTEQDAGINSVTIESRNCNITSHAARHGLCVEQISIHDAYVSATGGRDSYGISAETGITLSGAASHSKVFVSGGKGGLFCRNDITIANTYFYARGLAVGSHGVWAQGCLNIEVKGNVIYESYSEAEPFVADGGIYVRGQSQIDGMIPGSTGTCMGNHSNGSVKFVSHSGIIFKEYVRVTQQDIRYITGVRNALLLNSGVTRNCRPGSVITFDFTPLQSHLSDDVTNLNVVLYRAPNHSLLNREFMSMQRVSDFKLQKVVDNSDIGYTYWCEVSVDSCRGYLRSMAYRTLQVENTAEPVKPTLSFRSGNIIMSNAKNDQEYIIIPQDRWADYQASQDESWWVNSFQPNSNSLLVLTNKGVVKNSANYVVTRYKETVNKKAGTRKVFGAIYYGDDKALHGAFLNATPVGSNHLTPEEDQALDTYLDGIVKVEIVPVPANATDFEGALGRDWQTTGITDGGEDPFQYYSDVRCRIPLNDSTHYKTVYVRSHQRGCGWYVNATVTAPNEDSTSYNSYISMLKFNVGDLKEGFSSIQVNVEGARVDMMSSEVVEGVPMKIYPSLVALRAPLTAVVTERTATGGQSPAVTVHKDPLTLDVQTDNLAVGAVYDCMLYAEGAQIGSFPITIKAPELRRVVFDFAEINVNPRARVTLDVTTDMPDALALTECQWVSSDESVVQPLESDRTATFSVGNDASVPGKSATVTLLVGGVEAASCQFNVMGETYPLWIADHQVSSLNQHDILGDGSLSYTGGPTGGTLTMACTEISSSAGTPGIVSEIPNLTVDLHRTEMTVKNGSHFNGEYTYFTGTGFYKTWSGVTAAALKAKNMTLSDSVVVRAWSNAAAVEAQRLSVQGASACVQAYSYNNASMLVANDLYGTITLPSDAVFNAVDGWVAVSADNPDDYVTNSYVHVKGEGEELILYQGDVNADGQVNVSDVTVLVNMILGIIPKNMETADLDGSGSVNVSDVTVLINIILNKTT